MSDNPTLYVMGTTRMWPASRADLLAALGVEREWYCYREDGSYYGPCTPDFKNWDGWTDKRDWRHRHHACGYAYIVMAAAPHEA